MIKYFQCKKCLKAQEIRKEYQTIICFCGAKLIWNGAITNRAKELSFFQFMQVLSVQKQKNNKLKKQ